MEQQTTIEIYRESLYRLDDYELSEAWWTTSHPTKKQLINEEFERRFCYRNDC